MAQIDDALVQWLQGQVIDVAHELELVGYERHLILRQRLALEESGELARNLLSKPAKRPPVRSQCRPFHEACLAQGALQARQTTEYCHCLLKIAVVMKDQSGLASSDDTITRGNHATYKHPVLPDIGDQPFRLKFLFDFGHFAKTVRDVRPFLGYGGIDDCPEQAQEAMQLWCHDTPRLLTFRGDTTCQYDNTSSVCQKD